MMIKMVIEWNTAEIQIKVLMEIIRLGRAKRHDR